MTTIGQPLTRAPRRPHRALASVLIVGLLAAVLALARPASADSYGTVEAPPNRLGYFPLNPITKADTTIPANSGTITIDTGGATTPYLWNETSTVNLPVDDFTSVVLQVTVENPTTTSSLRAYPSGGSAPTQTSVPYNAGETTTQLVVVQPGANGNVDIRNAGTQPVAAEVVLVGGWAPEVCWFWGCFSYALSNPTGTSLSLANDGHLTGEGTIDIDATQAGVPADADQVVLRVFATRTGADAQVALVEPGSEGPTSLNAFSVTALPHQDVHTVMAEGGHVTAQVTDKVENQPFSTVDLRVSVSGWIDADRHYHSVVARPTKLADDLTLTSGATTNLATWGVDGLPGVGNSYERAGQVWTTVRASGTTSGTLSVDGTTQLQVVANKPTTNTVLANLDLSGNIDLTFHANGGTGSVDVDVEIMAWADASGYHTYGSHFTPTAPTLAWISWCCAGDAAGSTVQTTVVGLGGGVVPTNGVSAVLLQVETFDTGATSSVRVGAPGELTAAIPQVEIGAQRDDAAYVIAPVSANGRISLQVGADNVVLRASVVGWVSPYNGDGTLAPNTTTAVIGDSVTHQTRGTTYDKLHDELLLNQRGMPGGAANQLRWRAHELSQSDPANVIVELGGNDTYLVLHDAFLPDEPPTAQYSSAGAVATEFERIASDEFPSSCVYFVIYPGSAPGLDLLEDLRDETGAPGDGRRVGIIDYNAFGTAYGWSNFTASDGIHPNTNGRLALTYLYDQALTGSTDGTLSGLVPEPTEPIDWADYVQTCV